MKILVLNRGSSSIKCCLYHFTSYPEHPMDPLWEGELNWKEDFDQVSLRVKNSKGDELSEPVQTKTANEGLKKLLNLLIESKVSILSSLNEIDVIGHRIVHGGSDFKDAVLIDRSVKDKIKQLSELAPLHNIGDLEGIEIFHDHKQVAVFDTVFHRSLPEAAFVYPGPYEWVEKKIRRYGFHGISYQYCSKRCAQLLNRKLESMKMVICHLGSGASLCAIDQGKSIDTTMGFTPLEGLMMDTRSGTVDPGILLHLMKTKNSEEISKELYHNSGLLGLSGFSSDMKEIIDRKDQPRAKLALEVYIHRLCAALGAMIASLKGLEVLVFTAGIGENSPFVRKQVCSVFSFLGIKIDEAKNENVSEDVDISSSDSKIKVIVIRTKEAFEIARESWRKAVNG